MAGLFAILLTLTPLPTSSAGTPPDVAGAAYGVYQNAALAADLRTLGSEVRLRKLHLVRPDLIPFPVLQTAFC